MLFLICFFKQKTAYELRISDWSSDVCSSDLPHERQVGLEVPVADVGDVEADDPEANQDDPLPAPVLLQPLLGQRPEAPGQAAREPERPRDQIGRAACRERVCP